jgi:ABC-type phosphate transport system substrate-binding protein
MRRGGQRLLSRATTRGAALLAALVAGMAGACAPAAPSSPPAAPPWIAVTPGLEPIVTEWVESYRAEVGIPPFDLRTLPLEAAQDQLRRGELELLFAADAPPQGWFATPVGEERLAVVVHPDNRVRGFRLRDLERLFSGEAVGWDEVGGKATPIQVYVPFPGDELRAQFEALTLRGRSVTPNARLFLAPGSGATLASEDSAALGILPLSAVPTGLRSVRIEGALPEDDEYPFQLEILGMAPDEPTGGVREFLVWLQSRAPE